MENNMENTMESNGYDFASAKKVFSRIGWALVVLLVLAIVAQVLVTAIPIAIWGEDNFLMTNPAGIWIMTFAPIYAIAIPVGVLMMKRIPGTVPMDNKLTVKDFLVFLPMAMCVMYAGNIVGTLLSSLLSGGNAANAVAELAMENHPLKVIVMVILAPLLEELVFRKLLIDRTARFGEKTAVLLSAVTFGLFHMNLFQFFYAFALGWLFGYVYIRTGRLRYCVILHGIINFMGSVLAPAVLSMVDMEVLTQLESGIATEELITLYSDMLPGLLAYMGYAFGLIALSIVGLVLIITHCKKLVWIRKEEQLPAGTAFKTVYCNGGMILFVLLCLVFVVLALF